MAVTSETWNWKSIFLPSILVLAESPTTEFFETLFSAHSKDHRRTGRTSIVLRIDPVAKNNSLYGILNSRFSLATDDSNRNTCSILRPESPVGESLAKLPCTTQAADPPDSLHTLCICNPFAYLILLFHALPSFPHRVITPASIFKTP
jgi:hypothetical protein